MKNVEESRNGAIVISTFTFLIRSFMMIPLEEETNYPTFLRIVFLTKFSCIIFIMY